ncbi:MAG: methyltransferase domain-containing protein [Acidobacteria bacterium]|nr:methyltransferase domain-containing protein [Acidobacteriota bacterium]
MRLLGRFLLTDVLCAQYGKMQPQEFMTRQEIQEKISELGPWFYEFDFGNGLRTTSAIPSAVTQIFETRLQMVHALVESCFGTRLPEISCLDVGCHEGFYSIAMAKAGVKKVVGVDVRESNLRKARFVAETLGFPNITFRQGNCDDLQSEEAGKHELTLFLGLLYHLENPMLCLRNIASLTKELCIVETQVIDEVEGETEWGSQEWMRSYQGVLALIDESGEFYNDNAETGSTPLAMCPSPKALTVMLRHAGFRRIELLPPPPGAYEQHQRGKRVVCAAYK